MDSECTCNCGPTPGPWGPGCKCCGCRCQHCKHCNDGCKCECHEEEPKNKCCIGIEEGEIQ